MSGVEGTVAQGGPVLRVRFRRVHGRHVELRSGTPALVAPRQSTRRPAYVARLLALAHQLRRLLERGEVSSVGELARRLEVSQPRVTQVLNLTYLAPSIQVEVLALEAVDGVESMTERPLREVLNVVGWREQMGRWRQRPGPGARGGERDGAGQREGAATGVRARSWKRHQGVAFGCDRDSPRGVTATGRGVPTFFVLSLAFDRSPRLQ